MVEKKGSARMTATAGASEGGQQLEQQRPRPPSVINADTNRSTEAHPSGKRGAKQQANAEVAETMELRRPSDMHHTPRGMLDRSLQAQLGRQLRAVYSDIAEEPVPDRFVKLLEALEDREKRR